ncbi:MAG: OmpA family protein [Polyangiaceae bacterium]
MLTGRTCAITCLLLLSAPLAGCVSAERAKPYAALRAGCKPDGVEIVSEEGHDAVLDVCGVHEDWRWHAVNGWEYVGPNANQPVSGPVDTDGDGIPDDIDACPAQSGVATDNPATNGCPPPADADGDGIADASDACPQVAGVMNADPAKNGCPPPGDQDADGITDDVDACPTVAGVAQPDPAKNGCPDDNDNDGIKNDVDACPDEPGKADPDPKKNGCPIVQVTKGEIKINERIEFDTAKATIKPVSNALIDAIAQVMKDHPEITKVEIQGHTDNQGSKFFNKKLSEQRAASVMKALTDRGIDAGRLTSKGYGQDKPMATNDTDEGRQTNRRVQFQIMERDESKAVPPTPPPAAPATPTP